MTVLGLIELEEISSYSYCASKKKTYYGLKLHALVTLEGFITNIEVTPSHVDDRAALWELLPHTHQATILGNKGYVGDRLASDLKSEENITLLALKRNNSKILAHNIAYFMNKCLGKDSFNEISRIRHLIFG